MIENEKSKILKRISARVSSGLSFIEFRYLVFSTKPDPAWIRNIYILLSYYTELLFKAIYIAENDFKTRYELYETIKKMGHKLDFVAKQIGEKCLKKYHIKSVKFDKKEYLVKTSKGDFYVKDFIDIRYDFFNNRIRLLDGTENEMFTRQIEIMHSINSNIKSIAYGATKSLTKNRGVGLNES